MHHNVSQTGAAVTYTVSTRYLEATFGELADAEAFAENVGDAVITDDDTGEVVYES